MFRRVLFRSPTLGEQELVITDALASEQDAARRAKMESERMLKNLRVKYLVEPETDIPFQLDQT